MVSYTIYDTDTGYENWGVGTANRGETIEIRSSSEYKKWGDYSLRMCFDFTKASIGTVLGAYAGPRESIPIPGNPRAIGLWIYATEEAQGYWLRMSLYDGNKQCKVLSLTEEKTGVNWIGWRYVEAEIPVHYTGPFSTFPSQLIRIMSTASGMPSGGPMTKGSLYIDAIRVHYEERLEKHPPLKMLEIQEVTIEESTLRDEAIDIKVQFELEHLDADYLNYEKTAIWIDGILLDRPLTQENFTDNQLSIDGISLAKGFHRIYIKIEDSFGNEIRKEVWYEQKEGKTPEIYIQNKEAAASLGRDFVLQLQGQYSDQLEKVEMRLKVKPSQLIKAIQWHPWVEGMSYTKEDGTLCLKMYPKENEKQEKQIPFANISIFIPHTYENKFLTYEYIEVASSYKNQPTQPSFSMPLTRIPIKSNYRVTTDKLILGMEGKITVGDGEGRAVEGAILRLIREEKESILGCTNKEGVLESETLTEQEGSGLLWAVKEEDVSYPLPIDIYKPLLTEEPELCMMHITLNQGMRSISWMSTPLPEGLQTYVQLAKEMDFQKTGTYETIVGESTLQAFTSSRLPEENGIVRMHKVLLHTLEDGETYRYRIGNGEVWSRAYQFTIPKSHKKSTEFVVLGDMQSENVDIFSGVLRSIEKYAGAIAFIAQLGDLVDEASNFGQLQAVASALEGSKIQQVPWLHLLGNHELMGDSEGSMAKYYFDLPYRNHKEKKYGCYSLDFDTVHMTVISYLSNEEEMKEVAMWLQEDMLQSKKTWKILFTHQPPYFTNPDGGNEVFKKIFVPIIDKIGVDVVFSGHDHAYGRTFKLREDAKKRNGTTYIVCGAVGGKYYEAFNDGSFEVYNDAHEPLYLKVSATADELCIKALRSDDTQVDKVLLKKSATAYNNQ